MAIVPKDNDKVNLSGFILIDKPVGFTSHDVVAKLRKITSIRKIGHAGTLDPFATGLLIVGIGRQATKQLGEIVKDRKEYVATLKFGATSDTQDLTGVITETQALPVLEHRQGLCRETIQSFIGEISQIPPMYSAKKINGQKLYDLARAGQTVERQPCQVTIYNLEFLEFKPPFLTFTVTCSAGTYIRTLAHDMGQKLGVGAYLTELRRTKIGECDVTDAWKLTDLTPDNWFLSLREAPQSDEAIFNVFKTKKRG